ncbi:MAG: DNA alkylation repair protein [Eggerthellaceae bacterium]|nr:DNA alkylation repair protein [Eggerthellaceae bacterium]
MGLCYEDVFRLFREQADEGTAVQMSAYMRDQFPYLGLQTPVRRSASREFLKAAKKVQPVDWEFVERCWELEREFQYLALDYLQAVSARMSPGDIPRLREFALVKSWWDTVDSLDAIIGSIVLRFPEAKEVMRAWSNDESFWLRRIAINHQLQFREQTDVALLELAIVNNLGQTEFFINKAIGWALREYSKTDPAWVGDFVARYRERLAPLSIREASKYLNA